MAGVITQPLSFTIVSPATPSLHCLSLHHPCLDHAGANIVLLLHRPCAGHATTALLPLPVSTLSSYLPCLATLTPSPYGPLHCLCLCHRHFGHHHYPLALLPMPPHCTSLALPTWSQYVPCLKNTSVVLLFPLPTLSPNWVDCSIHDNFVCAKRQGIIDYYHPQPANKGQQHAVNDGACQQGPWRYHLAVPL